MTAMIAPHVRFLGRMLRTSGPYLILEILLPGGTLFALLLFFYRRRERAGVATKWERRLVQSMHNMYREIEIAIDPAVSSAWHGVDANDGMEALAMAPVN